MPPETSHFRQFLRTNRGIKVLALGLAVVSWYAIQEAISSEAIIKNVRMHVLADEGWTVLDQFPPEVDVMFRGSDQDLRFLQREQVAVQADVRGKSRDGVMVVKLRPENVKAPTGARPISIVPSEITLSLDREGDKEVPVKADIAGTTPEGFDVQKVVCTPATVVVHGPKQRLASIDSVRTEPIDLAGRARSFRLSKSLQPPAEGWSGRVDPDTVRVDVTIMEGSSHVEIELVRVSALIQPDRRELIRITPATVKVTLSGRPDQLAKLDKDKVMAYVDCSALQPGPGVNLPVRVQPPAGLEVAVIDPPMIIAELGTGD
ncbi:MAG TPA: CdaR family protein [Kiritimatiellia bacterium]|jgi:YbbR domain-containing protein